MSAVTEEMSFAQHASPSTEVWPPELHLMLRRVRLLARLRVNWLRTLWAERHRLAGNSTAHSTELEALLDDCDAPEAELAWRATQTEAAELAEIEHQLQDMVGARLARFVQIFGLTPAESDLLQACLAGALDPALVRIWAYLQEHAGRNYLTRELVARLFGHGRSVCLSTESALLRWELIAERDIAPYEPCPLVCDPQIWNWFLDKHELDRTLVGIARLQPPLEPLSSWPVAELARFISDIVYSETPARLRLTLCGPHGSGRKTLAALICQQLGLPLLAIDGDAIDDADWKCVFVRAQRQAFLDRSALAWYGEALARRPWPQHVPWFPIQFVIAETGQPVPVAHDVVERKFAMPQPSTAERRRLWQQYVPAASTWPPGELETLVLRLRATPGDIAAATHTAVSSAAQAAQNLRTAARNRLGDLAQRLECPFDWDDLVIAPYMREALEDIVYEASVRGVFWEQPRARRLFPQGRALIALFSGPPGTGKTMAAQVIAAQLGLELYRVDLSAVISKWVGETSQNLERLLRRASQLDVVLLFDEADAIYGKRVNEIRDAQDRFANMDVSHLMVAIENYDGIVLLASNLKSNIDPAFLRRLRYSLEFAKPGATERLAIWRRVIGGLLGQAQARRLNKALQRIAAVEATGAQIKNAVLAAIFMANREDKRLALTHLTRGLNREFAKEGYSLSERETEELLYVR